MGCINAPEMVKDVAKAVMDESAGAFIKHGMTYCATTTEKSKSVNIKVTKGVELSYVLFWMVFLQLESSYISFKNILRWQH